MNINPLANYSVRFAAKKPDADKPAQKPEQKKPEQDQFGKIFEDLFGGKKDGANKPAANPFGDIFGGKFPSLDGILGKGFGGGEPDFTDLLPPDLQKQFQEILTGKGLGNLDNLKDLIPGAGQSGHGSIEDLIKKVIGGGKLPGGIGEIEKHLDKLPVDPQIKETIKKVIEEIGKQK